MQVKKKRRISEIPREPFFSVNNLFSDSYLKFTNGITFQSHFSSSRFDKNNRIGGGVKGANFSKSGWTWQGWWGMNFKSEWCMEDSFLVHVWKRGLNEIVMAAAILTRWMKPSDTERWFYTRHHTFATVCRSFTWQGWGLGRERGISTNWQPAIWQGLVYFLLLRCHLVLKNCRDSGFDSRLISIPVPVLLPPHPNLTHPRQ